MTIRRVLLALALALALAGCRSPAAVPVDSALMRGLRYAPLVPDGADLAAADLAAAALSSGPTDATRAVAALRAIDTTRRARGESESGLEPIAVDLRNATFSDTLLYRVASRELLERADLDPALEARLEQEADDDPLVLASARIRDAQLAAFARAFNALAEPAGRSLLNTSMAPYYLGQSLLRYAVQFSLQEALPLQRRQALVHWKDYLARNPESPRSPEIEAKVEKAEGKWHRTQHDRAMRRARRALEQERNREALIFAERAMRHAPEDSEAEEVRTAAAQRVRVEREAMRWSEGFDLPSDDPLLPAGTRELALALLERGGDVSEAAGSIPERSPIADEARFALASAHGEAGNDGAMWRDMRDLADCGRRCNMARHAATEYADPIRNPYEVFRRARHRDRMAKTLWVAVGPWSERRLERSLPGLGAWLVELPALAQSIVAMPFRLLQLPWTPPPKTSSATAVQARRYLTQRPEGERADEVRGWLEGYERQRENWVALLRIEEERIAPDPIELEELREKAARQALTVASAEERRDLRDGMLHHVAREFADTHAGREAGRLAREDVEKRTPHEIRITRGFLEENPAIAGPMALGLDPVLLDEDPGNGELHPAGVALVGGLRIEIALVAPGGDEDDEPERRYETISEERLARLVSRLEETSFRNALIDSDEAMAPDAQRDIVFERARLGLADDVDLRPTAEATFAYEGLRERYGMVRARESILPFDLVVQGSLSDLSLGAFPRMRQPRQTPDAALYR